MIHLEKKAWQLYSLLWNTERSSMIITIPIPQNTINIHIRWKCITPKQYVLSFKNIHVILFCLFFWSMFFSLFDLRLPQVEFSCDFARICRLAANRSKFSFFFPHLRQTQVQPAIYQLATEPCDGTVTSRDFGRLAAAGSRENKKLILPVLAPVASRDFGWLAAAASWKK